MSPRPTPVSTRRRDGDAEEETPVVVSRAGRTQGRPRSRGSHQVAGGSTPPAEVRSASDRRVIGASDRFRRRALTWRRVVVALLIAAVVAAAVWAVGFSTLLTVKSVRVIGTTRQSPAAVRQMLQPEMGRPLARVDLSRAAQRVVNLPAVRSVQVVRAWPNELEVRVVERVPVAVVATGGAFTLLDIQGIRMDTSPKAPAGLPVVTPATITAGPAATRAVVESLSGLTPELRAKVRSAQSKTQDSVTFTLRSGAVVKWGSSEDSDRKAEVLAVLLSKVKAKTYDVTAPGTPVTK